MPCSKSIKKETDDLLLAIADLMLTLKEMETKKIDRKKVHHVNGVAPAEFDREKVKDSIYRDLGIHI